MTRSEVKSFVVEFLKEHVVSGCDLTGSLYSYNLDSIVVIDLEVKLENEYGIDFPDDQGLEMKMTVEDIVNVVMSIIDAPG